MAEPIGGANGDEPFSSVSTATSVAAHPRRSPRSFAEVTMSRQTLSDEAVLERARQAFAGRRKVRW
jgi:hypothetical protein